MERPRLRPRKSAAFLVAAAHRLTLDHIDRDGRARSKDEPFLPSHPKLSYAASGATDRLRQRSPARKRVPARCGTGAS